MKFMYFFILFLISSTTYAQNKVDSSVEFKMNEPEREVIFTKTEVPVSYLRGDKELFKFIDSNLNMQTLSGNGAVKGDYEIWIRFIVKKDGTANDFVPESLNKYKIEDEIIRILKTVPKWKPAVQNNHIVNSYYRLHFSLNL